jgi:hypothetical protein
VREKITAYAEEPEEMVKLPDADYDSVVEESVTRAIKRYASRQILVGPGGTGKFRGIFSIRQKKKNRLLTRRQILQPLPLLMTEHWMKLFIPMVGMRTWKILPCLFLARKTLKSLQN